PWLFPRRDRLLPNLPVVLARMAGLCEPSVSHGDDGLAQPCRRRHVRLAGREHAAVPAAQARLRPGERVGAVRRDAGGRDGADYLFQRGVGRAARDAAVTAAERESFAAVRAASRRGGGSVSAATFFL